MGACQILNDAEMGLSLPTRLEVGDNSCREATVLPAASLLGLIPADSQRLGAALSPHGWY